MLRTVKLCLSMYAASQLLFAASALAERWGLQDVINKSQGRRDRCNENLYGKDCNEANDFARDLKAIDEEAYKWVNENGWYVTVSGPERPGSLCVCGCFEAGTAIYSSLIADGEIRHHKVSQLNEGDTILTLDQSSTMSNLNYDEKEIIYTVAGNETLPLVVFELENGRTLKVTKNHGIVLFDGSMVKADSVQPSDRLVALDGSPLTILRIGSEITKKKVYNFDVASDKKEEHIVVAEGVLVGDVRWQNQYEKYMGQIQIRQ